MDGELYDVCVCVCVCGIMHVCERKSTYLSTLTYIGTIFIYTYIHTYIYIYIYIYMRTYTYVQALLLHRWLGGLERNEHAWIPTGDAGMHWSDINPNMHTYIRAKINTHSHYTIYIHVNIYIYTYMHTNITLT